MLLPAAIGIAFVAFADTSVLSRSYAARLHAAGRPEPGAGRARRRQPRRRRLPGLPRLLQRVTHRRRGGHGRPQPVRRPRRGAHPRRAAARRHRPGARHAAERPGRRGHRRRARPVRRARRPPLVRVAADRVRALHRRVRRRRRARRAVGCRDRDRAEPAQLHPSLLVPARRRARPGRPPQGLPRHRPLPRRDADPRPGPVPLRRPAVLRQRRQLQSARPCARRRRRAPTG